MIIFDYIKQIPPFITYEVYDHLFGAYFNNSAIFQGWGIHLYTGKFGTGKTSTLAQIAYNYCVRYPQLSILTNINLQNFPEWTNIYKLNSAQDILHAPKNCIVVIDETTAVGVNLKFGGGANFGGERISTFDKEHGVQTQEHHKDVIRDLISRDKNHACVVMWSIANEPDSAAEGAYDYFKPLYDLARELDPQKRPCTLVSVQGTTADTDCSSQLSDVICLNRYYGWYFGGPDLEVSETGLRKELSDWGKLGKPVMFTEYGADTVSGLHDTTSVMYTEEYQVEYYEMNNKVFDEFDFVVGEQAWNFADFATSQSLLRVQGNKKGLFTRDRKPKMVAHYFRNRWSAIPEFGYKTK